MDPVTPAVPTSPAEPEGTGPWARFKSFKEKNHIAFESFHPTQQWHSRVLTVILNSNIP